MFGSDFVSAVFMLCLSRSELMKKLNAKRLKRHMLKTSEFWQLDEKFLVISPDKKLRTLTGMESLPESETGYLGYAFLDDTMRVAFLGVCDEENGSYKFFDGDQVLVAQAWMLPTMLVRIVKPSEELEKHPFVQGVLKFHESDALRRSTLALRQIDHLRDPLRPAILKAAWIKNEKKLEATFNESVEQYLEVLAAAMNRRK
jgi:hypothetical protein